MNNKILLIISKKKIVLKNKDIFHKVLTTLTPRSWKKLQHFPLLHHNWVNNLKIPMTFCKSGIYFLFIHRKLIFLRVCTGWGIEKIVSEHKIWDLFFLTSESRRSSPVSSLISRVERNWLPPAAPSNWLEVFLNSGSTSNSSSNLFTFRFFRFFSTVVLRLIRLRTFLSGLFNSS